MDYLTNMQHAAQNFKEIVFFRFFFPVITILAIGCLFYFGVKGIVKKETILLAKAGGAWGTVISTTEQARRWGKISGTAAVIVGVLYIVVGVILTITLGPLSYFILK